VWDSPRSCIDVYDGTSMVLTHVVVVVVVVVSVHMCTMMNLDTCVVFLSVGACYSHVCRMTPSRSQFLSSLKQRFATESLRPRVWLTLALRMFRDRE